MTNLTRNNWVYPTNYSDKPNLTPDKILELVKKQNQDLREKWEESKKKNWEDEEEKTDERKQEEEKELLAFPSAHEKEREQGSGGSPKWQEESGTKGPDSKAEASSQESIEKPERNFLTVARDRINQLMDKQDKVEKNLDDRIEEGLNKLSDEERDKISTKFIPPYLEAKDKVNDKSKALEKEYEDELKPVGYFRKKADIEASAFKKIVHVKEKLEEEVDKKLKEKLDHTDKEEYEKERSEWQNEHKKNIRECRQEKQNVQEHITSNLQKASEMALDLLETEIPGPDQDE